MNKVNSKTNKKVMVALSGGIDSAVSAVLLIKQGYTVEAGFMKNWSSTTGLLRNECPWIDDRREALKVAAKLGIPMHTFDFEKEYADKVMEYFFKEYSEGRTPNPDVMCNKEIKFKLLYNKAMAMGFDYLATGHYAQVKEVGFRKKRKALIRSKDEFKDQTYFIYNIRTEQLEHILFPVGGYKKPEIRKLAHKFGLPNADRKESMGLCFVGKIRLEEFLNQKIKAKPGDILNTKGERIGEHKGIAFYTVGQRHGLNVGGSGPYYIVKKDLATNTLVVSPDPNDIQLQVRELDISGVNWIKRPKEFPFKCQGRFRHQQDLQKLKVIQLRPDLYRLKFAKTQTAVASGQSLVIYTGKECIGGGVIT